MARFRDIPIQRKLMLVIMATSTTTLLVATAAVAMFSWKTVRGALVNDLDAVADVVGANSTAAIAFHDRKTADETLSSLKTRAEIVSAQIYDRNGELLGRYNRPAAGTPAEQSAGSVIPNVDTNRYLQIVRPIYLDHEIIGHVHLQADLQQRWARLRTLALIVGVLIAVSWLVVLMLSTYLQRLISAPILALARVARDVQERKDYSLRARKQSQDEIGALVDGFNQMLGQVESRDEELRASEERFRQLAENINEVFWMTDVPKSQMVYISPAYETIWGRTRESLYAAPQSWLEAIHPEDRERVRVAASTKQTAGEYDEQYRVVRPTGEVRWIRDRAYPVRNENGQIYRTVGIAEDITERKRLEKEILDISNRERLRIGQDVHDGLCQHLAGTAFAVTSLEQTLADLRSPQVADVQKIAQLIDRAITEARHIAQGLSPVDLDPNALMSALDQLAANVSRLFDVDCTFSCQGAVHVRNNTVAMELYRIAREGVNNAIKHGKPKHIWLALTSVNGRVNLTVEDDGVGIPEGREHGRGMGLHIMAYRARTIGGLLDIQRQATHGTIVTCSVDGVRPHANGTEQP